MNSSDPKQTRDTLVAVVSNDADLERFRQRGTYRIPTRTIGRSLGRTTLDESHYLALYQTASITNGIAGAIELWGEIVERTVAPRRQILPDQPDHPAADELYHLLTVHPVEQLPQPVVALNRRRFAFLRTSRERLLAAATLDDLPVGTAAEERLWREIQGWSIDAHRHLLLPRDGVVMELSMALFANGRGIGVVMDDNVQDARIEVVEGGDDALWKVIHFAPAQLEDDFTGCVHQIESLYAELRSRAVEQ